MGLLEWLGIRRSPAKPPQTQVQQQQEPPKPSEKAKQPELQKPVEWHLPREDMRYMSDSEKINYILQGVYGIYDELRPLAQDGTRISRLQLLLENLGPDERAAVKRTIEDLDIDNMILKFLEFPKSIEEIAGEIKKSYGYTAARLRFLRGSGKVARLRDPASNKYKYTRVVEGRHQQVDLSSVQKTLDAVPGGQPPSEPPVA